MSELQFYLGGSGCGKSTRLYNDVIRESIENPQKKYIVVVPDQFTLQTQKNLCALHPRKGSVNIDITSFERLADRVVDEIVMSDDIMLDDMGKNLIIRRITQSKDLELQVMEKTVGKMGYVNEIKSCISEFLQYGVSEKSVDKMIEYSQNNDMLSHKLEDLKEIYLRFKREIAGEYSTLEEVYSIFCETMSKSKILSKSTIIFDEFTGFTPVQYSAISEMMLCVDKIKVCLNTTQTEDMYGSVDEQELSYLSCNTISRLERIYEDRFGESRDRSGDIIMVDRPYARYVGNEEMAFLEENIFRFNRKKYNGEVNNISIHECKNYMDEVQFLCQNITKLVREEKYKYNEIAIVSGDVSRYDFIIHNEFSKYKIPFFIDGTKKVEVNPCIEAVKGALSCVISGYNYADVFYFLRSGVSILEKYEVNELENYVIRYGIRGKERWESEWKARGRKTEGADEIRDRINGYREKVVKVLAHIVNGKNTAREFAISIYNFITAVKLEDTIEAYRVSFGEKGDIVREKEYEKIYPLFIEVLDQIVTIMSDEVMTLKEFSEILYAGFDEIKIGVIPQKRDEVIIGDIERTRLKQVKAMFFIGVNDGVIPKANNKGGIISDVEREFLQGAGVELAPTPRQNLFIQRFYMYLNVTKPTDKLYISYSNVNFEGKSIRPAYFVFTMKSLFPKLNINRVEKNDFKLETTNKETALEYLGELLRTYVNSDEGEDYCEDKIAALIKSLNVSQKDMVDKLVEAAFYRHNDSKLDEVAARLLYGIALTNSVSRLEKFSACAYSYFLRYGLQLKEREEFELRSVDIGNLYHESLEKLSLKLREDKMEWIDIDEKTIDDLSEWAVEECCNVYDDDKMFIDARTKYGITRMKRIIKRTVKTLQYQLNKGEFVPSEFELSFSKIQGYDKISLLGEGKYMNLCGKIDRIDISRDIDNRQTFLKVIDYKSSEHSFDYVRMYHGLQLQLMVYLKAATDYIKQKYKEDEVIPSAILYYHVTDPIIDVDGENSIDVINTQILKKLRPKGLVLENDMAIKKLDNNIGSSSDVIPIGIKKDGEFTASSSLIDDEFLGQASKYVSEKVIEIGNKILDGNIDVNPCQEGEWNSCIYCGYRAICKFDRNIEGYKMRAIEESEDEVINLIRGKSDGGDSE